MAITKKKVTKSSKSLLELLETKYNAFFEPEKFSTGILPLDEVLGGAIETGSLIELASESGVGKSTLALDLARNLARLYQFKTLYIDTEGSVKKDMISGIGLTEYLSTKSNPDNYFTLVRVAGYTEVEELISKSLQEGQFKLIVIDSLSALTGDVYLDLDENRNSTENRVGFDAQMTSRLLKKLNALKTDYDCIFFCINQTRVDLSNPWQASFKSTGGQAVKFFPDVRLFMKRDKVIYDQATLLTGATDKATVGATTTIEAIKSRLGQGFIKYPMTIYFGKGISNLAAYVSLLELPTVVNSKGVTVLEHVTKVTNVLHLDSGDYQSTKGANGLVLLIKEHWDEVEKICFNYVTNYFHEQHTVSEDTDYDERDDLTYEENKLVDYTADDTEDLDSAG